MLTLQTGKQWVREHGGRPQTRPRELEPKVPDAQGPARLASLGSAFEVLKGQCISSYLQKGSQCDRVNGVAVSTEDFFSPYENLGGERARTHQNQLAVSRCHLHLWGFVPGPSTLTPHPVLQALLPAWRQTAALSPPTKVRPQACSRVW